MMAGAALLMIAGHATADMILLYDVDFSTPPHTVGNLPVTGTGPAPRKIPTSIWFGDPTVVVQLGAMNDQPCAFGNGTTGYDQIEFAVDPAHSGGFPIAYNAYRVEMNVLIEAYVTSDLFKILFDCPTVNNIAFRDDGTIRLFPTGETIGTFTFGVPLLLEVELDFIAGEWTIWLDGSPVHTGPLTGYQLRAFRMNLNGLHVDNKVAIDELRVYGGELPPQTKLLYDVDFATPPHTVGNLPVIGTAPAPRKTPTTVVFGDPTVVAALGALAEQPCAFGNGTTGYDQLKFHVDPSQPQGFPEAYDVYLLSLVAMVDYFGSSDEFEIILDCPTVHKVRFKHDGTIQVYPGGQSIGQYAFGVPVHVQVVMDVRNDQWTIWLNGNQAYVGPAAAEMLRAFRLQLDGTGVSHAAAADEVRLWGIGQTADIGDPGLLAGAGSLTAYPNPTSDGAWIRWETPFATPVQAEILTITGRRVWSRAVTTSSTGIGEIRWDAKDASGQQLPSGVYFARVRAGSNLLGRQMIVLRR